MDSEDILFLIGTALISLGAWGAFGHGFGLLACGGMLVIPPLLSMLRSGSPPKDKT